jgi:hypothetical protein
VRAVTIIPDTKDWTWVLDRPCPECGLDTLTISAAMAGEIIRGNARQWQEILGGPGDVARRPAPGTWSGLEYGCHVRDVLRRFDERLVLMLTTDGPRYPNWDQDATALAGRYAEQDPVRVAAELGAAADVIAARFDEVSGDQWQRTGFRSDGARFTIATLARYLIHDPVHHLYDVTAVAATARPVAREQVADWIAAYELAWRAPGTAALARIFTPGATYRQGPYEEPVVGLPAISRMWEAEREGPAEIFRLTGDVIAVDAPTAVARLEVRYGDPVRQEYRDLWIMRFAGDGRCASFEEWPFSPR